MNLMGRHAINPKGFEVVLRFPLYADVARCVYVLTKCMVFNYNNHMCRLSCHTQSQMKVFDMDLVHDGEYLIPHM